MRYVLLLSALVLTMACGGAGEVLNLFSNPNAGNWSGPFLIPSASQSGTVDITITPNGSIAGTGRNNTQNIDFVLNGTIDSDGNVSGDVTGGSLGTLNGNLSIAQDGHLRGTLTQTQGATTTAIEYNLTKQ